MDTTADCINIKGLILFVITFLLSLTASSAQLIPSFIEEPQSTVISERQVVLLVCNVVPSDAKIKWLFDGTHLRINKKRGFSLQGNNLKIDSGAKRLTDYLGTYQCKAVTSIGTIISRPAVLSKAVFEFGDGKDVVIDVHEGGTVTLPCFTPNISKPAFTRFQHADGTIIDTNTDNVELLPSGNIVIKDVRLNQKGDYRCIIYNPSTDRSKSSQYLITLNISSSSPSSDTKQNTWILETDSDQNPPTQIKLFKGGNAVLECPSAGTPEPKVNWTKYVGFMKKSRFQVISGNLHMSNIDFSDEGTYLCSSNGKQRFVTLEVTEAPMATVDSDHIEAELGSSQRLICNVKGRPLPNIQWYRNGQPLKNSFTKILNGETAKLISKMVQSDEGIYQCMATNPSGVSSASIYLRVKDQVLDPSGADGDEMLMMMNTNSPNDTTNELMIEDDEDDKPIKNQKKDHQRKKKKNKRKKKKNRGKNKRKHKNGRNRVKLVPPSQPKVIQQSESSVILNWTVPDNDGLPVKFFRVQYKEVAPVKGSWKTEDPEINKKLRSFEVNSLKKGGFYKFRIAAVYTNDDNAISKNSPRFQLEYQSLPQPVLPAEAPTIVKATPIFYKNVYCIGVQWQYRAPDSAKIKGFIIYYKPYEDTGKYVKNVLPDVNVREYLIKHLKTDTEYSIKMQTYNHAGESEFSNVVVKRTRGKQQSGGDIRPAPAPIKTTTTTTTETPGKVGGNNDGRTANASTTSHELYMIIGIVLGIMVLALIVFMLLCWWKQRQQRRAPVMNGVLQSKFHDPSQRIYSDSMRKKYTNGYPPTNGYISNGHGPHSHSKMKTIVNPVHPESMSLTRHTDTGKYYHNHIPNGNVGTFGHGTSDNNFNNINSNKKQVVEADEVTQPMLCDNDRSEFIDNGDPLVYTPNCCSNHHYHQTIPEQSYDSDACRSANDFQHRGSPMPQLSVLPDYVRSSHSQDRLSHRHFIDTGDNLDPSDHQSYESLSTNHSGRPSNKQRHRRKHRHSREHPTRDQATNTDLSSNEGTIEFTTFNKHTQSCAEQNNIHNSLSGDSFKHEDFSHQNQVH